MKNMTNQTGMQKGMQTSQPLTPNMSEKDLLNDLLNQEKQHMSAYSVFISESVNTDLRHILTQQFNQTAMDQYDIFHQMTQKGFYQTKQIQQSEITQAQQKFSQMKNEL